MLTSALTRAAAGSTFAATIEGEAGIGKSRLIGEAIRDVDGLLVLWGKASELERERPFGPLLDALGLRSEDVASVAGDDASAHQFAVADHFLDLIERATTDGPAVLVVEDLHWADAATLSLLGRLARQRGPLNTSLLCTRRPAPRSSMLEALLRSFADDGAVEMHLGPLDEADVHEILAELTGTLPGPRLLARVRGAAGNPLYVIEFVEGLGDQLTRRDGLADLRDDTTTRSLPLTIVHRLGLLPTETVELLRSAAVLGASFALSGLAAVANRQALELLPVLEPAIDAGVVVPTAEGFRFRHDLIHEAAYADTPEPFRRLLHAAAASALAADPTADVTHVARHFELSTSGPDTATSDWLWRAALTTFDLDPITGIELMTRSVARTPRDHPASLERRIFEVIKGANLERNRLDRARALLREPLPDLQRWVIEAALVTGLALFGDVDDAEQLALATPRPRSAQAAIAVGIVAARCLSGDPDHADRVFSDLLTSTEEDIEGEAGFLEHYARGRDDPAGIVDFWLAACHGLLAWARGENDAGPGIARRWEQIVREFDAPPQAMDCVTLLLAGDSTDDGWRAAVSRIGTAASRGFPEIDASAGFAHWFVGEWDEALVQFETSLRRAESAPRCTDILFSVAALIEAERGRPDAARAWLDRSRAAEAVGLGAWVEAVLAEFDGDLVRARRLMVEAWRRDNEAGMRIWQRLYGADLVRHATGSEDDALAKEAVAVAESLVPRGGDLAVAVSRHCRALYEACGEDLVAAAEGFRRLGRPLESARAGEDAAAVLAAADLAQAQLLFDRATTVYEALGAQRDLARLARRSLAAGVTRKASPERRPTTGWDSLTESELRVAGLVSEGLTYRAIGERLFVSRRTVETHVAHVFAKLEVRSKAALASAYVLRFGGNHPNP